MTSLPITQNLIKVRQYHHLTQKKAANLIGITRACLGAYEEGRSQPGLQNLLRICKVYSVSDIMSFINDEHFDVRSQIAHRTNSFFEERYQALEPTTKKAVNILLGI